MKAFHQKSFSIPKIVDINKKSTKSIVDEFNVLDVKFAYLKAKMTD